MADFSSSSEPTVAAASILTGLWQKSVQENMEHPSEVFNTWVTEVCQGVDLDKQVANLIEENSLWLPTTDQPELEVLLGVGFLAKAFGCQPAELGMRLGYLLDNSSQEFEIEVEPHPTKNSMTSQVVPADVKQNNEYYREALLEELMQWQTTFELALEEAGKELDSEKFPANQLEEYLTLMCSILRKVL